MSDQRESEELQKNMQRWEKETLQSSLDRFPERREEFITTSSELVNRLYTPADLDGSSFDEEIGYLVDYGTAPLDAGQQQQQQMTPQQPDMANFQRVVSQEYALQPVTLQEGIPEGLRTLIIAGPSASFSDYDLFKFFVKHVYIKVLYYIIYRNKYSSRIRAQIS